MDKLWSDDAWEDYLWWESHDRKTLERLNRLIRECERTPFEGEGRPEPLRGDLKGAWSRRIDRKNRLVYWVDGSTLHIVSCRSHYGEH